MSGFEVIGVVLGAFSLVLEAVKTYHSATQDNHDLKRIRQWVKTERLFLQNTCEKLLVSIVPNEKIAGYLEDPFGPLWKTGEAQALLRLRLWTSYELFEETVQEMRRALNALKRELERIFVRSTLIQH
ncbi:hypothetical protein E8E14_003939 [Neopestalotiopsis sp. 37M]|nr:hypothetical protein E8E14_003939 [Neopestalotiopsis sp. 37M]